MLQEQNLNVARTAAGLAITGAGAATFDNDALLYTIKGDVLSLSAGTTTPTGSIIADGYKAVMSVLVDNDGTISMKRSTPKLLADVLTTDEFSAGDATHAVIGYIVVETNGAEFEPGVTLLDAATATVSYFDTMVPFGISK